MSALTQAQERPRTHFGLAIIILLAAVAVLYGQHAVTRHGQDALDTRATVLQYGKRYDCQDGRSKMIYNEPGKQPAVMVLQWIEERWVEITTFKTTTNRVQGMIDRDGCTARPGGLAVGP
jgi:hypothetical protein